MRILVTDIAFPDLQIETEILKKIGAEPVLATRGDVPTLVRTAAGCSAIMTCWAPVTKDVIDACVPCLVVSRYGIGIDNIDVSHCTRKGIPVTYVPDYCIEDVADHTLALILGALRKVAFYDRQIKSGAYNRMAGYPMHRLRGLALGIVGFGRIGQAVSRRAIPFGLKILVHSKDLPEDPEALRDVDVVSLPELLGRSDVVSLHLPLTPETRHVIGRAQLAMMRPGAFLINTSRGGLVDPAALLEALDGQRLLGAALDVTDPEPLPASHPLSQHERVLLTPHAAFLSVESLIELRQRAAQAVVDVVSGQRPRNLANPEIWASRAGGNGAGGTVERRG